MAVRSKSAERLDVSIQTLYSWKRRRGKGDMDRLVKQNQNAVVLRCKAELRRRTEERGLLKNGQCQAFREKRARLGTIYRAIG